VLAGYAAGLAARAEACRRSDGAILALAALDHALAGCRAVEQHGPGGATPLAVAQQLSMAPILGAEGERGSAANEADGLDCRRLRSAE
jgi:hypothetical protein